MQQGTPTEREPVDTRGMNFAIVVSKFNANISEALLAGALRFFNENKIADDSLTIVHVPGAFEIPLVAKTLAATGMYGAVIALGAVIRGETAHFEYVAGECARGLQQAALETRIPILFGVLTTETLEQALARCADNASNKGYECAAAAVDTAGLMRSIDSLS